MRDDETLRDWMLDSDPALRWQVQRDLAHEPPEVWQATRARVPDERVAVLHDRRRPGDDVGALLRVTDGRQGHLLQQQ